MPEQPPTEPAPQRAAPGRSVPDGTAESTPVIPAAPGVLTTLLCERCGNENLIRVKGCWYCEKCHHKFDCYGW
jgi:hypothetical protein